MQRIFKRLAKALVRLCVCTGWSEPLLVAHTILLLISCRGLLLSNHNPQHPHGAGFIRRDPCHNLTHGKTMPAKCVCANRTFRSASAPIQSDQYSPRRLTNHMVRRPFHTSNGFPGTYTCRHRDLQRRCFLPTPYMLSDPRRRP